MDTTKIVSLKQEQITLDSQIQDLGKKLKSKQIFLILGIVSLLLSFIIFFIGADGNGPDYLFIFFFLFCIATIVFLVLSFLGKKSTKTKLAKSKNRSQDINGTGKT